MHDFNKCKKCNKYHWDNLECDPIYLVYYEEYMGDDPKEIRATNHEDAALVFAQYYNTQSDYCLMNETITVKVEKDGVIEYYEVGAEPYIYYSSKQIDSL